MLIYKSNIIVTTGRHPHNPQPLDCVTIRQPGALHLPLLSSPSEVVKVGLGRDLVHDTASTS